MKNNDYKKVRKSNGKKFKGAFTSGIMNRIDEALKKEAARIKAEEKARNEAKEIIRK